MSVTLGDKGGGRKFVLKPVIDYFDPLDELHMSRQPIDTLLGEGDVLFGNGPSATYNNEPQELQLHTPTHDPSQRQN